MCSDVVADVVRRTLDMWRNVVLATRSEFHRGVSGTLRWGVPFRRREENRMADVTLHDDEEVMVTVAWTDERGRPTVPPPGVFGSSSDPAVEVRDSGDATNFVVGATGAITDLDVTVRFGGEGVVNAPVATVRVIRWRRWGARSRGESRSLCRGPRTWVRPTGPSEGTALPPLERAEKANRNRRRTLREDSIDAAGGPNPPSGTRTYLG
jgi:hypothetical protein